MQKVNRKLVAIMILSQNKFTISKHQNKFILDDADLKRKPI